MAYVIKENMYHNQKLSCHKKYILFQNYGIKPFKTYIIHCNIGDLLILEMLGMRACRNTWSLIVDSAPSHILNYIKATTMQYTFVKAILHGCSMNMEDSYLQKIVKKIVELRKHKVVLVTLTVTVMLNRSCSLLFFSVNSF